MDIYLAQPRSEGAAPPNSAWLVCPFTPDFHLPEPKDGIFVFTDSSPCSGQRPEDILQGKCASFSGAPGLVLDFQRPAAPETRAFVEGLRSVLPCPVAAPPDYAGDGPVFLPPLKPHIPPDTQLEPWLGRDIWLDLSPCPTELLLTKDGCQEKPGTIPKAPGFEEKALLCHYRVTEFTESVVRFTLWRTREDLLALASQWDNVHYIALRQEWEV